MAEKLSNGTADPSGSYPGPHLVLSPKTVKEAITFMIKGFGEYPDELRIAMYLDTLGTCTTDEVWSSVKVWMRHPHDRAAKPGELFDMIVTARGQKAPVQLYEDAWEERRATPAEIDEVFAAVGLKNKPSPFIQALLAYRQQYKRAWEQETREAASKAGR